MSVGSSPKKEGTTKDLQVGGWVRISDTCRSAAMRGQLGVVKEVGRQVDVAMGGDDATVRKLNPNDLVFVGMVRARPCTHPLHEHFARVLCSRPPERLTADHRPSTPPLPSPPLSPPSPCEQEAPEQSTS